ncbi:unnamed protein product [Arctia plantaginis]|uniref:Receptor expression-enhancing protein 1 n=1 Tax=Arctia plantaginis TaxID=874455 RepID=A0A8S1B4W1_ARCPL|nr:unnamed protein product [Arctia plantaginis]
MISSIISRLVILIFGTLYPAYASYKAVRTKNLKEYVKWMMYWIVFALFTCTETFTDVFLSWFPFYYEVKIVLVLWLLSPATKGSSILYRKFVHPALCRREQEIDEYIAKAKDQGYHTVLNLGTKGVNYATTVIMQTAIKNLNLPSPEQDREPRARQAIGSRDVTDGDIYEDLEYQRSDLPGIVEIVELNNDNSDHVMGEGDVNDPDYEPDDTSARSRGNIIRKRKTAKDKEKRPRSKSRGRRTRSQAAQDKEILGGGGLVQQLRKSYSLSDLTECEPREERGSDEADDVLTEPRLVRRGGPKSGYRRSASESNSRSPMYFPEVDVDVRPRPRSDEPDFSHIKSSEDISSGYSSADNSASLSRAASLGAAARARGRSARVTCVTPIKRPQAAEENEVIIEELHDTDSFEYANMPPLVNLPTPMYLSHTQPPFIYQYVGDHIKILQVLGTQLSNSISNNEPDNNTDHWDQKEIASEQTSLNNSIKAENIPFSKNKIETIDKVSDVVSDIPVVIEHKDNNDDQINIETKNIVQPIIEIDKEPISINIKKAGNILDETAETTCLHTSQYENDSVESDDEASFGTPENSPKSKRKLPKGKYGKCKAPSPPMLKTDNLKVVDEKVCESVRATFIDSTASQESLVGIVSKLSYTSIKKSDFNDIQFSNLVEENKGRQKSKSPANTPKSSSSGIGKLLQLPSKLAFWHKTEDKPKTDDTRTSSDDLSRRSSTSDQALEGFQSCSELNTIVADETTVDYDIDKLQPEKTDQKSFADVVDVDNEVISKDIIDKSDALQKLIEAKIENHPDPLLFAAEVRLNSNAVGLCYHPPRKKI